MPNALVQAYQTLKNARFWYVDRENFQLVYVKVTDLNLGVPSGSIAPVSTSGSIAENINWNFRSISLVQDLFNTRAQAFDSAKEWIQLREDLLASGSAAFSGSA